LQANFHGNWRGAWPLELALSEVEGSQGEVRAALQLVLCCDFPQEIA